MTQNHSYLAHAQSEPTFRRQSRIQLRADTEASLRDIAFVLKMTERVRTEIEAKEESEEFAIV